LLHKKKKKIEHERKKKDEKEKMGRRSHTSELRDTLGS